MKEKKREKTFERLEMRLLEIIEAFEEIEHRLCDEIALFVADVLNGKATLPDHLMLFYNEESGDAVLYDHMLEEIMAIIEEIKKDQTTGEVDPSTIDCSLGPELFYELLPLTRAIDEWKMSGDDPDKSKSEGKVLNNILFIKKYLN